VSEWVVKREGRHSPVEGAAHHALHGLVDVVRKVLGQAEVALGARWVCVDSDDGLAVVEYLAGRHQVRAVAASREDHVGPLDGRVCVVETLADARLHALGAQRVHQAAQVVGVDLVVPPHRLVVRSWGERTTEP